jgi:hypothetical protein
MATRIFLLFACLGCSIGLLLSKTAARPTAQGLERGEVIQQPDTWVAFTATVQRTLPNGQVLNGSFYRGDDGSELLVEQVSDKGQTIAIRHITNYTKSVYYHSAKPSHWFSGPLLIGGPRQLQTFYTRSPALRRYPHKLALRAGDDGALNATEGLEAWIVSTDQGAVHLMAPELNFYPVVSTSVNGARRLLSNIVIGPISRSFFEPPPTDTVETVTDTWPPAMPNSPRGKER